MLTAAPDFLTEFAETRRYQAGRPVGAAVTPDGSAVLFNAMPPYVTDLVVSHPQLVDHLRAALLEAASS